MGQVASTRQTVIARRRFFVERFAEGHSVGRTCELQGISLGTYYSWRSKDPEFAKRVDEIKADPYHRKLASEEGLEAAEPDGKSWKKDFAAAFARTNSRTKATEFAGVTANFVAESLDETSEKFDPDFASMVREVETRKLWDIEDNLLVKSKTDSRSAQFVLQSRMREKYGKQNVFGATADMAGVFWFSKSGEDEAKDLLRNVFGGKTEKQIA